MKHNHNAKPSDAPKPVQAMPSAKANPADVTISHDSEFTIQITKTTTPKDIREWTAKLEELVAQKKKRVRDDLAKQVNGLLADNEYTVEELLGARILPSTADLAEMSRKTRNAAKERALQSAAAA
ncbi:MAG: hypothetical protein AAGJ70_10525 [Pseudomonadota bacterium]